MKTKQPGRRDFLKSSITTAAVAALAGDGLRATAWESGQATSPSPSQSPEKSPQSARPARIKFAVIAINHNHIYGQVEAVTHGGGELTSFYAKEPDLAAQFAKRFPNAKLARSEKEILEDPAIKLVLSSGIPNERAPLGIDVMRHGKDYMVDKPGMTTLEQLEQVRRVQAETKRIYSILYSERHENKATV
jgi:hypothetical protein